MSRATVTRDTVALRHPISMLRAYNVYTFGDSFAATYDIGSKLNYHTTSLFTYSNAGAQGGYDYSEVRAIKFPAYPVSGKTFYMFCTGINDVILLGRTAVAAFADLDFMASTVKADGYQLCIVGSTPFKGHAAWTSDKQAMQDELEGLIAAAYPDEYVRLYDRFEDPANPNQMNPVFLRTSGDITNLHINENGNRLAEELISQHFYFRDEFETFDNTGNYFAYPNSPDSWVMNDATIGGSSIRLSDGSYASDRGVITVSSAGITNNAGTGNFTGVASGTACVATVLVRPGNYNIIRVDFMGTHGTTASTAYIDLDDFTLGATTGSVTPTMRRNARGWTEIKFTLSGAQNTGSNVAANYLKVWAVDGTVGSPDISSAGDGVTPSIYVDKFRLVAA